MLVIRVEDVAGLTTGWRLKGLVHVIGEESTGKQDMRQGIKEKRTTNSRTRIRSSNTRSEDACPI